MNLGKAANPARLIAFRTWRWLNVSLPGGRVKAFGQEDDQIGAILVINLDRQPNRWRRINKELRRFRTSDGERLTSLARRLPAVDARDGRAVAATADVDPLYRIGDQLYVQPDPRLAKAFAVDEPVRMSRQEVAVARSHVEAWKEIVAGDHDFALILEDDAWFKPGAKDAIDRGWRAALGRFKNEERPNLLYLSYADAGGTALREAECEDLFRPVRGLWFLSGYVLSKHGAATLLHAMPVVGPVDLWMNYRFAELGALALSAPAIAQRHDEKSDNAYSMMPYLARAGIVDGEPEVRPSVASSAGPVLAWTGGGESESLAMALSMLGLRVRVFDAQDDPLDPAGLSEAFATFDALVDPPLRSDALGEAASDSRIRWLQEDGAAAIRGLDAFSLPKQRSALLTRSESGGRSWDEICALLDMSTPAEAFPNGSLGEVRMFRDGRSPSSQNHRAMPTDGSSWPMDDSPWLLPVSSQWRPSSRAQRTASPRGPILARDSMSKPSAEFPGLTETFPGNLSSFAPENLEYSDAGVLLTIDTAEGGLRPYQSAAFASVRSLTYGRAQAEFRAAPGPGLITGFFLHRASPRQEIDIEIVGSDPRRMLTNVFFNPGDDGTQMSFGYRGSPCWIDLGFDATEDLHEYAIDWRPDRVAWLVDGEILHERASWDPTPIPHLPMQLHGNLWAPRSQELAGRMNERTLPLAAAFRNVLVAG